MCFTNEYKLIIYSINTCLPLIKHRVKSWHQRHLHTAICKLLLVVVLTEKIRYSLKYMRGLLLVYLEIAIFTRWLYNIHIYVTEHVLRLVKVCRCSPSNWKTSKLLHFIPSKCLFKICLNWQNFQFILFTTLEHFIYFDISNRNSPVLLWWGKVIIE